MATTKPRKGHNEGSVFERKNRNGKVMGYQGQVSLPGGKRLSFSGKTKREVREKMEKAKTQSSLGLLAPGKSPTLEEYLLETWLPMRRENVRPRTYESYDLNVRRLLPHLGAIRLEQLKPAHIQACYGKLKERGMQQRGLSARSIQQCHTVLHGALQAAVRMELMMRNQVEGVTPPRPGRSEMKTLTPDQVRVLFTHTASDRLRPLWVLLVTTGMRVGEALGLAWDDIDFDTGSLTIRRALQRQRGKGLVLSQPKTGRSRRTIYPDSQTMEVLKAHRAAQLAERVKAGPLWEGTNSVFTTPSGRMVDPGNVRESLGRRLKGAGLPAIRVHDLRHTAATFLFSQGKHPSEVQALLGHSTVTLTLDTYTHVLPPQAKDTTACMSVLFPASETQVS